MLKTNRGLSPDNRQQMIRIRFAEPIDARLAKEFYRIHLSRDMKAGGEDDFYRAELIQPHRVEVGKCPQCGRQYERAGLWKKLCRNRLCKNWGRINTTRPMRGVVRVDVPQNWLRKVDGRWVCDSVLLVLDRRYGEKTLKAVYRTAGALAEMMGWKIL